MHFGLTEEQQLLQETVRGFVEGECPPTRLRELFDEGKGHDPALWKGVSEMGLAGLMVPEELGGAGLDLLELALVMEEVGGGALPGPIFSHALACLAIQLGGDDAQRRRWLPALASGDRIATLALCEEGDVWDPEGYGVSLEGGGLRGTKRHVPHAAIADLLVVATAGGGFAVLERDASGVTIEDETGIDHSRPIAKLSLDAAPAEALSNANLAVVSRVRDAALVLLAADAFGAAWNLTRQTVEYAKSRQQFGSPIAQFQSVKHQLADMATTIEPARGLFWYAAHAWDREEPGAARDCAIAKAHITDEACNIARAAVELHGGLGFTWECDVQLWFKRAMFDRTFCGTPAHHRARIGALGDW